MKPMMYYEIDFSFIKEDPFLNRFIEYYVETQDATLKETLKAMGLPYTTYAYARKNGIVNSKKVTEAFSAYFDIDLTIDETLYDALRNLVYKAITESYFVKVKKLREVQDELKSYKDKVKGTPLYFLYALAYLSAFDHFNADQFFNEMEEEVLPFLEYKAPVMSHDVLYFYTFSKTEYFFYADKDEEAVGLIEEYERLDPYVNERLKTMGYFDLFTLYALKKQYARCLSYIEKCEALCFKYYNPERLKAIRQNKTAILFHHESYEEALANARGDLLFIYRNDLQENRMFFKILIVVIVSSLIKLGRYEEAVLESEKFFDYELEDYYGQALLFQKLSYYKMKDEKGLQATEERKVALEANGHEFPKRYYALSELINIIHRRKKQAMKTFGARLKPYTKEQVYHYNRIAVFLKDEYEAYLKETGHFIEVLDM